LSCKARTGLAKGTNDRSIYVSDHRRGNSINILQHAIDPVVWECAKDLYQRYMMDDLKVKKRQIKIGEELKRKYEVVEQEICKVQSQIDKLEERIILGKISTERSRELSKKLTDKLKSLDKDKSKILDDIRSNLNKIKEYLSNPNKSLESLSFKEQYDIVHKVIDKVLLSKPDPKFRTTIAEIYSKVDNKIYIYKIRTKVVHWELIEVVNQ
jgi:DNA repair exonuclease SbcCD ATPase subunit